MLERCYSKKLHLRCPTYTNCSVCAVWVIFSNFKWWMGGQDWEGKDLDKDIIVPNNKEYSPDNCAFVDKALNRFFLDSASTRGAYPKGVHWSKINKKFNAKISAYGKIMCMGYYDSVGEAEIAYLGEKCAIALVHKDNQTDTRVKNGIQTRIQQMSDRILELELVILQEHI